MSKITRDQRKFKFETLQLHVGQEQPDPVTDARAVPIYQTSSYVFRNCDHAAARFGLADAGNIYGRLTNPTEDVFEKRIAALEGGSAALAVASGAAAITYTIENLAQQGDHIVAAKNIYGGTTNLLEHTLPAYGITTTFVDVFNLEEVENAIQENTKAVYIETLGNPNSDVVDIEALAKNIPGVKRIRFFMTFGQSYLTHMKCLENVGLLSTTPITFNGQQIVPIQFLKELLPDPSTLGPRTVGKTNIGCIFTGIKDGKERSIYIYNVCDHQECYREVESQAISYTTGVPAMIGTMMVVNGLWNKPGVYTTDEFDPDPYMEALNKWGLPWKVVENPVLVD